MGDQQDSTAALDALTTECPLVLVLEDLHWSDRATLEWLAYVARRPDPARLLILGTYRPVDVMVHAIASSKPELLQNIVIRRILDHHTLPPEAATVFNRTQPKLAVYSHIVLQETRTVPPPTIAEVVAETRRTYSGPLQAGEDLMSFDVTNAGVKISPPPR